MLKREYAAAVDAFSAALRVHAADHMALFKRATAHLALHKSTEAINDLTEALKVRRRGRRGGPCDAARRCGVGTHCRRRHIR